MQLNIDGTNKTFRAFVTGPENSTRGLLMIHEWWGLNEVVASRAREFGEAGFRVMAIDLFDGKVATDPETARSLTQGVKQEEANAKYLAALKALQAPGRKLAIIGWSFGGGQVLHAALVSPKMVQATVMYYPSGNIIMPREQLNSLGGR